MSYAFISKKSFVIGRFFNTGSQFSPSQATEDDRVLFRVEVGIEVVARLGRCEGGWDRQPAFRIESDDMVG